MWRARCAGAGRQWRADEQRRAQRRSGAADRLPILFSSLIILFTLPAHTSPQTRRRRQMRQRPGARQKQSWRPPRPRCGRCGCRCRHRRLHGATGPWGARDDAPLVISHITCSLGSCSSLCRLCPALPSQVFTCRLEQHGQAHFAGILERLFCAAEQRRSSQHGHLHG